MAKDRANQSESSQSKRKKSPQNESDNQPPSKKARVAEQNTKQPEESIESSPTQQPEGPVGLEKYNAEYQNFPFEDLEHDRTPKARKITWLTHYQPKLEQPGFIFFGASGEERYSGPFDFLSNFYNESRFKLDIICPGYEFESVEQLYQFARAFRIAAADARTIYINGTPVSSKTLYRHILKPGFTSLKYANLGRIFKEYEDEEWRKPWETDWEDMVEDVMRHGLRAKFDASPDLKDRLMMTGNFQLVSATDCGIGIKAFEEPMVKRNEWEYDILGTLLMELRETYRQEDGNWPSGMAFDYHRAYEKMLEYNRQKASDNRRKAERKKNSGHKPTEDERREDKRRENERKENERKALVEVKASKEKWLAQKGPSDAKSEVAENTASKSLDDKKASKTNTAKKVKKANSANSANNADNADSANEDEETPNFPDLPDPNILPVQGFKNALLTLKTPLVLDSLPPLPDLDLEEKRKPESGKP